MKKSYFLFLILLVLLTCGCSNNLKCTKEANGEINSLNLIFKDDKPDTLEWERTIIFASDDAYIDMSYLELQEYYSMLDNYQGIKYQVKEKDKNDRIIVSINVDLNKYTEFHNFSLPITIANKNTNIAYLEQMGYKCK